jgi:hypothetical protein
MMRADFGPPAPRGSDDERIFSVFLKCNGEPPDRIIKHETAAPCTSRGRARKRAPAAAARGMSDAESHEVGGLGGGVDGSGRPGLRGGGACGGLAVEGPRECARFRGVRQRRAHSTSNAFRINYYSSAQLNADFALGPLLRSAKADLSLLLGYRYNNVLGHGAGAGVAIELWLSESVAGTLLVAPSFFPSAQSQLDDHGYPLDRDAALPWLQGGAGVALSFHP